MAEKITRQFRYDLRELDSESGIFEGYASATNVVIPFYNEVVMPGAFDKTLRETKGGKVPILNRHFNQIGLGLEGSEDKKGFKVRGKVLIDKIQEAAETWALMELSLDEGVPTGLSIGFRPIKDKVETEKGKPIRKIIELQLVEYSVTPFPANPKARITKVRELLDDISHLNPDEIALFSRAIDSLSRAADRVMEPSDGHSDPTMALLEAEVEKMVRAAEMLREPSTGHSLAGVKDELTNLSEKIEVTFL